MLLTDCRLTIVLKQIFKIRSNIILKPLTYRDSVQPATVTTLTDIDKQATCSRWTILSICYVDMRSGHFYAIPPTLTSY